MQDICKKQGLKPPVLYDNKTNRFAHNQGDLGDCWFLEALANWAENKQAFKRVVPSKQGFDNGQYIGAFRFHFDMFLICSLLVI